MLLAAALAVVVFSAAGAVAARDPIARLHFLAPVTTLAVPLFCASAALTLGLTLGTATIVLTGVVLAFGGPVLTAAVARSLAAEASLRVGRSPE
ncbi:monovalent cation/H(+) antiporter subunit G [Gryllotalpicola reticulitermitis]|uniref:Monovalent cation/H(+) antiporter subunit G n=1 Tax=Gryllotalpicola reticulitermitis TaxID=1184153 RepID=A0ABV8Q611_9MICO